MGKSWNGSKIVDNEKKEKRKCRQSKNTRLTRSSSKERLASGITPTTRFSESVFYKKKPKWRPQWRYFRVNKHFTIKFKFFIKNILTTWEK